MSRLAPLLKTALFTVFVPGTVAGYVPWVLRNNAAIATHGIEEAVAIAVVLTGVLIYLHTAFWGFAWTGAGTPAPIAPPKTLVVKGLHRFVRNPMYVGVLLAIGGQAWLFLSRRIAVYALLVWVMFHLWVLIYEEPTLRRMFGEEYERYCASVPRWLPRLRR